MFAFLGRASRLGLLLAAALMSLAPLQADEQPWNKAMSGDPKAILAAAEAVSAGDSPVVVLLDEETFTLDEQGRSTGSQHVVYRVVSEAGVEAWSTIEAPWSPWYQQKPEIDARVITRDGSVHMIDRSALGDAPLGDAADMFSDNRILRGPLPAVAAGSIVEQVITYRDSNPLYEAGTSQRFYFGRYVPVHEARLIIDYPTSLALKTVNKTVPQIQPLRSEQAGRTRLTFSSGEIKGLDNLEWNTPSDESQIPYVGFSTGKAWQNIARHYSEIVDRQIGAQPLKSETAAAIGSATSKPQIMASILAAIERDIRYAGVEYGESSIVPHEPRAVLANKYGDCKDKATLLVAMLREAGIPANVALLKAGHGLDVSPELPGMGEFNHAIVVTDGPSPVWIDPTDEFARAGELPVEDQGRLALVSKGSTTALTLTPVAPSSANRIRETREFFLSEQGKARVIETNEPAGGEERTMRRTFAQSDRKKYRDSIEQYVQNGYAAKSLGKFDAGDPHDLTKPFKLSLEAIDSQRGLTDDGEAAVAIFTAGVTADLPFLFQNYEDEKPDSTDAQKAKLEKKKRVNDFVFPEPYVKEWEYRIQPPPGFTARQLPENKSEKLGPATLTREYSTRADGMVVALLRFDTGKRRINAADFEALRKAVHELEQQKPVLISFDQTGKLRLNEGNVGQALVEYRKLVALHPTEAQHHVEIARALLVGGMGEAAREEIRKATTIEPGSAKAWRMLGLIMQHDLVGRRFRKGFDMKASIAAYRKAKELDSKDVQIRGELSDLLEFGDDGVRFGKNARLDDAIAELLAMKNDLKNDRVDGELMLLYARAGHFKELKELASTSKDAQQKDASRLVAIAAVEGSSAALKESESIDQSSRRSAIESAAGTMALLRLYPQAADLFAAAAQGATNASALRSRAESLRKTKRSEEVVLNDDPQGLVRRVTIAMADDDFEEKQSQYLTKETNLYFEEKAKETSAKQHRGASSHNQEEGVSPAFVADFILGNMQLVQDGNEATGYRVKMRSTGGGDGGGTSDDVMWVVREGGRYRIVASAEEPSGLGLYALRLAEAGKLEAARQWLDWGREIVQARGADDPLASPPFAHLWARGRQGTADEIKLAAATLIPRTKKSAELALTILLPAREKATSDDSRMRIDCALASAYAELEDWPHLLEVSQSLAARYPESTMAYGSQVLALLRLDRRDELKRVSNERLKRLPDDKEALRTLASDAQTHGEYDISNAYYQKIIDASDPSSTDYNNKAWNALFTLKNMSKAVEEARQSVDMRSVNSEALHTLAALYAEEGKTSEARDSLLKSMDLSGEPEPQGHDWYVLGRIAENYGETASAQAAYARVDKPERDVSASTWILAQSRLKQMNRTVAPVAR